MLRGSVAYGWEYEGGRLDLSRDPLRGYLHKQDDGLLRFETLDESVLARRNIFEKPSPTSIVISTPLGAGILLDTHPLVGGSFHFGGSRASVLTYRAYSLLFDIDLNNLTDLRLNDVACQFSGLGGWAGLRMLQTESGEVDDDGYANDATIRLRPIKAQTAKRALPGSLSLEVDGNWGITERHEEAAVTTALVLRSIALRPRPHDVLMRPLLDIQDLLCVLYRGFVPALPSRIGPRLRNRSRPLFWTKTCMHVPRQAIEPASDMRPLLPLKSLGGAAGLARWVRLCQDFPDVTTAVTATYREGAETPETIILHVGAAFELWVAHHNKTTAWAKKKNAPTPAHAIARHTGGPAFERWTGSSDAWAAEFWDYYNAMKHRTGKTRDPDKMYLLASSGRWLLTTALLDRVARSKAASRGAFSSHTLDALGERMRAALKP